MFRKLALRRELLGRAEPGAVYLPFCGDGDIAAELYVDRAIFAIDLEPDRIAVIRTRLGKLNKKSAFLAATADSWPGKDADSLTYAVGDFDAYSEPYTAFREFWQHALKTDRLVLFFTDGHRQGIIRTHNFHAPDGKKHKVKDVTEARRLFNSYWAKTIEPWFTEYVKPWRVVRTFKYLRGMMLYWGAEIERPAATPAKSLAKKPSKKTPAKKPLARTTRKRSAPDDTDDWTDEELGFNPAKVGKFDPLKKRAFLQQLTEGISREAAAASVGVTLRTVEKHVHAYPTFKEAISESEMMANGRVKRALYEAAISGNVTAIQVWLYNRDAANWRDKRNVAVEHTFDARKEAERIAIEHGLDPEDVLERARQIAARQ